MNSLICPVSIEKIDSNASRMTVFINVVLMGIFIYTLQPVYVFIVTIDYFIRAFLNAKWSPIRWVGFAIVKALGTTPKPIGVSQKVFASRLGFLCAFASSFFILFEMPFASQISIGILFVLSIADSVFNFCVGCLIYNFIVYPFYLKSMK